MEDILDQLTKIVVNYSPRLIGAIFVWIIGLRIIKILLRSFSKMLDKGKTDKTLKPFLKSVAGILLKVLLVISVLGMIGIEMSSFIAILGAAGLAVGLALSGTLQNFAGGVMILIFKPFQVSDVIQAQGYTGKVDKIRIFYTILKTFDNKTVIIPNGDLSTSSMVNFTAEDKRRVDWTFGIAYGDDVDTAKKVINELFTEEPRILADPKTYVKVSELADSSVNFAARAWVKTEDYWDVYFDMHEKVYKTFNKQGLNIPYPQMDVHMDKI